MNKSSLLKQTLVAVVGLTAGSWLMADDPPPATETTTPSTRTGMMGDNEVRKVNKCSELIGMEVKNPQGDRLGKVNDVVIDFSKDRIAYVVLDTSKPLGAAKLHAVPLRAFQPGEDGKTLILNADKDKVANAEGFNKDAWPSPSSTSWGAQPFGNESGTRHPSYREHEEHQPTTPPR